VQNVTVHDLINGHESIGAPMTSPFFGENSPKWTDMSDYVVHFAKHYEGKNAYTNMLSILANRVIHARNPFGISRDNAPDPLSQKAVCFSEIPLHLLGRLADKRSEYGIVFRKDFVVHRRGNPIFYAYKDQPVTNAIRDGWQ
jgi:Putative abortive phage resistance protein AbiGi, antitoxin